MRKAILISAPAVSAMVNWTPISASLQSLTALLHPVSPAKNDRLVAAVASSDPDGQPAEPQDLTAERTQVEVEEFIVVINPTIDELISPNTPPEQEAEDGHAGQIEDADIDFLSRFLPPLPTAARGDPNAPISAYTSVAELEAAIAAEVIVAGAAIDDTEYLADEYLPVTDNSMAGSTNTASVASPSSTTESQEIPLAHDIASQLKDGISAQRQQGSYTASFTSCLRDTLQYFYSSTQSSAQSNSDEGQSASSTNSKGSSRIESVKSLIIPSSTLQWLVFSGSFTITLLLILSRALLVRQRQRSCRSPAVDLEWSKLTVAGVDVGHVKRKTLRRGECVWVLVKGEKEGDERMEKVWLEDGVSVRGREVWNVVS